MNFSIYPSFVINVCFLNALTFAKFLCGCSEVQLAELIRAEKKFYHCCF